MPRPKKPHPRHTIKVLDAAARALGARSLKDAMDIPSGLRDEGVRLIVGQLAHAARVLYPPALAPNLNEVAVALGLTYTRVLGGLAYLNDGDKRYVEGVLVGKGWTVYVGTGDELRRSVEDARRAGRLKARRRRTNTGAPQ